MTADPVGFVIRADKETSMKTSMSNLCTLYKRYLPCFLIPESGLFCHVQYQDSRCSICSSVSLHYNHHHPEHRPPNNHPLRQREG